MKKGDGVDCKCAASSYHDCGCGADWTPSEVYELREKLRIAREAFKALVTHYNRPAYDPHWAFYVADLSTKTLAELGDKV